MATLSGKVALVTGAANGIGRAIAERLLAEGVRVLALDREEGTVSEAAAELGSGGGEIEPVAGDISRRDDVVRAIRRCVERFGGLDVLVANAGIADAEPFLEIGEESWRRIIDVNLTGTFFCIQEAARVMVPVRKGAIVVTSSTNGWYVESNMWHYNASKGGVIALVRSAALDLGPYGVRVNAVEPSMVRTRANFVVDDPVFGPPYLTHVPLGRFADPAEIASVVAFLASDEASYVTGQALTIDGGLTLGVVLPLPATPLPGAVRAAKSPTRGMMALRAGGPAPGRRRRKP